MWKAGAAILNQSVAHRKVVQNAFVADTQESFCFYNQTRGVLIAFAVSHSANAAGNRADRGSLLRNENANLQTMLNTARLIFQPFLPHESMFVPYNPRRVLSK